MAELPNFTDLEREARTAAERQRLLDMFAAHALIGIVSAETFGDDDDVARSAYDLAEAMMSEREHRLKRQALVSPPAPVSPPTKAPKSAMDDDDGIPF